MSKPSLIGDPIPSVDEVLTEYLDFATRGVPSQVGPFQAIMRLGYLPSNNAVQAVSAKHEQLNRMASIEAAMQAAFSDERSPGLQRRIFLRYILTPHGEKTKYLRQMRRCSGSAAWKWIQRKRDVITGELYSRGIDTSNRREK